MFANGLTDFRNDALNAGVVQLVHVVGMIIQDSEGQQRGICFRGVNLQWNTRNVRLVFTNTQYRRAASRKHVSHFKHLVDVFHSHAGDVVQQRGAVLVHLG